LPSTPPPDTFPVSTPETTVTPPWNAPDPAWYDQQLQQKLALFRQQFAGLQTPLPEVFRSEPLHFRMRAEFRIWHEGDRSHYAMTPPGQRKPQPIDNFAIGSRLMLALMPALLAAVHRQPVLRQRLYAVEFLTTLSGEALVTLIYHRALDQSWTSAAQLVRQDLQRQTGAAVDLIGRSRRQKLVVERDYVDEKLTVDGCDYRYRQMETGFSQPNAGVNEKMLAWASDCTRDAVGDLLELYCGNGNFTLVLARNFNRVLATELSKISVDVARINLDTNATDNVDIVRLSSEEVTEALARIRPFRRLRNIDLDRFRFSTVFVDPPRAGLDPATLDLVRDFERILYISCNPNTLRQNLESLSASHDIARLALFDQFPWSHHTECGVLLIKHPSGR